MRNKPVYVLQMGELYRLTLSQWKTFLLHRTNGWVNIENYGIRISNGMIPNITDWDKGRAQFELDDMSVRG